MIHDLNEAIEHLVVKVVYVPHRKITSLANIIHQGCPRLPLQVSSNEVLSIDAESVNVITIRGIRSQAPINTLETGATMRRIAEILECTTARDHAGDKEILSKRSQLPKNVSLCVPDEWRVDPNGTIGNFREQRLQQCQRARVGSPTRTRIRQILPP